MKSNYEIVRNVPNTALIIRDVGPWDRFMTVTNNAETVVIELNLKRLLPKGRRLFCYDSNGDLDEMMHQDGRFVGFAVFHGQESEV